MAVTRRTTSGSSNQDDIYEDYFSIENIRDAYYDKVIGRGGPGMDGIGPAVFHNQRKEHFEVIHRKAINGSYRFTPYREILKAKGRKKSPRVVSIPTFRDRITLHILKCCLHDFFEDCINKQLPNEVARSLSQKQVDPSKEVYLGDIRRFYKSIDHGYLHARLTNRLTCTRLIKLIFRAINTPTVPKGYRKGEKSNFQTGGVPQGLSISNILAEIALEGFDSSAGSKVDVFVRYVDDILCISDKSDIDTLIHDVEKDLGLRGDLSLNTDKEYRECAQKPFRFIGYTFALTQTNRRIGVPVKAVDRFLNSTAARFKAFVANYDYEQNRRFGATDSKMKDIFISEINEKITGCIASGRRYGWVFFYSEITDLTPLYEIENTIHSFFQRCPKFKSQPNEVERLSRAYHEAHFRPNSSYFPNYDQIHTTKQMAEWLANLCLLDPKKNYAPNHIKDLFEREKLRRISKLRQDTGILS